MSQFRYIIYKTLKTFYPHNNIGITPEIIEGILNKAGISKKNSSKTKKFSFPSNASP